MNRPHHQKKVMPHDRNYPQMPYLWGFSSFSWHGHSPYMRYGALQCPHKHHSVKVTYHADSMGAARLNLIQQWEVLVNDFQNLQ